MMPTTFTIYSTTQAEEEWIRRIVGSGKAITVALLFVLFTQLMVSHVLLFSVYLLLCIF